MDKLEQEQNFKKAPSRIQSIILQNLWHSQVGYGK